MKKFAEVVLRRPIFGRDSFTFEIPKNLQNRITIGSIVEVPLSTSKQKGLVVAIDDKIPDFETREIIRPLTTALLTCEQIEFAKYIAKTNYTPLSRVIPMFLLDKFWESDGLAPTDIYLEISEEYKDLFKTPAGMKLVRGVKQKLVIEYLKENEIVKIAKLQQATNVNSAILKNLLDKGILKKSFKEILSTSESFSKEQLYQFSTLTDFQKDAFDQLRTSKQCLLFGSTGSGKSFLIRKLVAEIFYADLSEKEEQFLILVPEIALTFELQKKFEEIFGPEILQIYHSRMNDSEKYLAWWKIKKGTAKIILGSRSAMFLPFQNLKLVAVEEEHDSSYKSDQSPRYHVRIIAEKLANLFDAQLIYSSATPSLETYFRATEKHQETHQWCFSTIEIKDSQNKIQNKVQIVDMKNELLAKNFSPISKLLERKIAENLSKNKKVILFLNRRGMHNAAVCRDCGLAQKCHYCNIALTHHVAKNTEHGTKNTEQRTRNTEHNKNMVHGPWSMVHGPWSMVHGSCSQFLLCHHCGRVYYIPEKCQNCGSTYISLFGFGTQKIEQILQQKFATAKILRADRDTTQKKRSNEDIFEEFFTRDGDILIGTQIVTKSFDSNKIGLVGIVLADIGLQVPDFRAAEKTFQNLVQVAGRTGRFENGGEVIIQTFLPDHFAIQAAAEGNYQKFYKQEIQTRSLFNLPPFTRIIKIIFVHPKRDVAYKRARDVEKKLVKIIEVMNQVEEITNYSATKNKIQHSSVYVAPALIPKKHGKYYVHLFIHTNQPEEILKKLNVKNAKIDLDPIDAV